MPTAELTTRAIAPWFGAGRTIAPLVGQELRGCKWVGVPFAGGMSEIAEISARACDQSCDRDFSAWHVRAVDARTAATAVSP